MPNYTYCSVPQCKQRGNVGPNKEKVSFHSFPKESNMVKLWLSQIKCLPGRNGFEVNKTTKVCSLHFKEVDFVSNVASNRALLMPNASPSIFPCTKPVKARNLRKRNYQAQKSAKLLMNSEGLGSNLSASSESTEVNIGIHFERWIIERSCLRLSDVEFAGYLLDLLLKVKPKPENAVSAGNNRTNILKDLSSKTFIEGLNISNSQLKKIVAPEESCHPVFKKEKVERFLIEPKSAEIRKPYFIQRTVFTVKNTKRPVPPTSSSSPNTSCASKVDSSAISVPKPVSVETQTLQVAKNTTKDCPAEKMIVVNKKTAIMPDSNGRVRVLQLPPNVIFNTISNSSQKPSGDNERSSSSCSVDGSELESMDTVAEQTVETSAVSEEAPVLSTQQDDEMIVPETLPPSNCHLDWIKEEHKDGDKSSRVEDKNFVNQLVLDVVPSLKKETSVEKAIKTEPPDEMV